MFQSHFYWIVTFRQHRLKFIKSHEIWRLKLSVECVSVAKISNTPLTKKKLKDSWKHGRFRPHFKLEPAIGSGKTVRGCMGKPSPELRHVCRCRNCVPGLLCLLAVWSAFECLHPFFIAKNLGRSSNLFEKFCSSL